MDMDRDRIIISSWNNKYTLSAWLFPEAIQCSAMEIQRGPHTTHVNGYTLITIIVYEIVMLDWSPVDLVRAEQTIRGSTAAAAAEQSRQEYTPTHILMVADDSWFQLEPFSWLWAWIAIEQRLPIHWTFAQLSVVGARSMPKPSHANSFPLSHSTGADHDTGN